MFSGGISVHNSTWPLSLHSETSPNKFKEPAQLSCGRRRSNLTRSEEVLFSLQLHTLLLFSYLVMTDILTHSIHVEVHGRPVERQTDVISFHHKRAIKSFCWPLPRPSSRKQTLRHTVQSLVTHHLLSSHHLKQASPLLYIPSGETFASHCFNSSLFIFCFTCAVILSILQSIQEVVRKKPVLDVNLWVKPRGRLKKEEQKYKRLFESNWTEASE